MRLHSKHQLNVWKSALLLITTACSVLRADPLSSDDSPHFVDWIRQFNCTTNTSSMRNKSSINDGLSAIHLVNCSRLTEINDNMFCPFPTIKTLNIRNSEIRTLGDSALNGLRQLESFAITFNQLTALRKWSSHYFNAMESVDFQSNDISELALDALHQYPNVETINLANNQIASIPYAFFANTTRIRSINLSDNRLTLLAIDDFFGLGQLTELSLSQNQIRNLSQAVFRSNGELVKLQLDCNQLERLDVGVFRFLTHLQLLNLSTNALTTIEPNALEHNTDLQHLDLSDNRIQELRPEWAIGLRKLEVSYEIQILHFPVNRCVFVCVSTLCVFV